MSVKKNCFQKRRYLNVGELINYLEMIENKETLIGIKIGDGDTILAESFDVNVTEEGEKVFVLTNGDIFDIDNKEGLSFNTREMIKSIIEINK